MTSQMEIALVFATVGAVLTLLSSLMKRMIPLRMFAVAANGVLIVAGALEHNWISMGLQSILLMVSSYRLWDLHRLIRDLEHANADTPIKDWLLPHMRKQKFKAGQYLFRQGDPAHQLFYIRSGTISSPELRQSFGPGELLGEIGLFAASRKRAASMLCETDCVCHTMTDEAIHLLYSQNPKVGFYLMRLIIQRLLVDLQKAPEVSTPGAPPSGLVASGA